MMIFIKWQEKIPNDELYGAALSRPLAARERVFRA
jgi:hypothetical protein